MYVVLQLFGYKNRIKSYFLGMNEVVKFIFHQLVGSENVTQVISILNWDTIYLIMLVQLKDSRCNRKLIKVY